MIALTLGSIAWFVSSSFNGTSDTASQRPLGSQTASDTLDTLKTAESADVALPSGSAETTDGSPTVSAGGQPSGVSPDTNPVPATQTTPPSRTATVCTKDMADMSQAYQSDIKKEKASLDKLLSSLVTGVTISSRYVADHNTKVLALFNRYNDDAIKHGCVFPL